MLPELLASTEQVDWDALIAQLSPEQLAAVEKAALGIQARRETPEGYAAFYKLIFGHAPPRHVMEEFIGAIFESLESDWSVLIWASRLFWKTTTITITHTAWQIGLHPERANLIIAVNDDKAAGMAEKIADIIDHHPNWQYAFPHVTPDKDKGWGAQGYEIKCAGDNGKYTGIEQDGMLTESFSPQTYSEWRALNTARNDASFRGVGYRTGDIIGMHPDGLLVIDDIHDEGNTESQKEIARVVSRVRETILPLRVNDPVTGRRTKLIMVGTPWNKGDAYHAMKDTGRFVFREVPVMRLGAPNAHGATYFEHEKLKGWYTLTWPDHFSPDRVLLEYDLSKYRGFMRMYMLTIIAASDAGVKYVSFPAAELDAQRLVVVGGVDYASVMGEEQRGQRGRSFFAFLWAAHLPQGGVVIVDGVFDQITRLQAETHLMKVQNTYPLLRQIDFELDGRGGEAYVAIQQRHPTLRVYGVGTKNKNKYKRFEDEVQPDLEDGSIMVSDADTPALNALRESLENYPYGNMDILDACYYIRSASADALGKVRAGAQAEKQRQMGTQPLKKSPWKINPHAQRHARSPFHAR